MLQTDVLLTKRKSRCLDQYDWWFKDTRENANKQDLTQVVKPA